MLQDGSKIFGMEKLSLLILLEKVSRKTDLIEPFEIATMLLVTSYSRIGPHEIVPAAQSDA